MVEGAPWSPEVIPTHIKKSVQGLLSPYGTGQQQQTWQKHNTTQVNVVQPTTCAPPEGEKAEEGKYTELEAAPPPRGYRDNPTQDRPKRRSPEVHQ